MTTKPTLDDALRRAAQGPWNGTAYGPTGITRAKHAVAYFDSIGKPHLDDIGSDEIELYKRSLQGKGLKPSTVNQYLSAVGTMFEVAGDTPALTKHVPRIRYLKVKQKRERILSNEEEKACVAFFANDPVMLDMVHLGLDTGLRESELLELTSTDGVDLDDAQAAGIIVRSGKTEGSAAAVALTARAVEIVKRRAAGTKPGGKLFGDLTSARTVQRRFAAFRDHMGLSHDKGFTFHCLRHTTCTRVVDSGMDVSAARDFLRHSDIKTTLRYLKSSTLRQRKARDVLEARVNIPV